MCCSPSTKWMVHKCFLRQEQIQGVRRKRVKMHHCFCLTENNAALWRQTGEKRFDAVFFVLGAPSGFNAWFEYVCNQPSSNSVTRPKLWRLQAEQKLMSCFRATPNSKCRDQQQRGCFTGEQTSVSDHNISHCSTQLCVCTRALLSEQLPLDTTAKGFGKQTSLLSIYPPHN